MKKHSIIVILSGLILQSSAQELLEDFESGEGWKKWGKAPVKFEVEPNAAVGQGALKLNTPGMLIKHYKPDHEKRIDWDQKYKGIALRIKGDGSENWGSFAIGGHGWSYRYYFPLKNSEWHKIIVPWSELVPEDHRTQAFNTPGALPTSGIFNIIIGDKWEISHGNRKLKPFSYCVDQVELIEDLEGSKGLPVGQYQPADLEKVLKKMKNGEPVTIFCLGDSITAGVGVNDRQNNRYSAKLQKKLREHFKNEKITIECRGVGGARANHCIAWINRDFAGPAPDLITYMIGYNNKSGAQCPEIFEHLLNNYINRVTAKTQGKTAILLIPTIPGGNHRFNMLDDYAAVVRKTAKERELPYCDVAAEFKKLGRRKMSAEYMNGTAHPNAKGQQVFADTLFKYLSEKASVCK